MFWVLYMNSNKAYMLIFWACLKNYSFAIIHDCIINGYFNIPNLLNYYWLFNVVEIIAGMYKEKLRGSL